MTDKCRYCRQTPRPPERACPAREVADDVLLPCDSSAPPGQPSGERYVYQHGCADLADCDPVKGKHGNGCPRAPQPVDSGAVILRLTPREADVAREALAAEAANTDWSDADHETMEAVIAKLEAQGARGSP